jgi:hypothetical protein
MYSASCATTLHVGCIGRCSAARNKQIGTTQVTSERCDHNTRYRLAFSLPHNIFFPFWFVSIRPYPTSYTGWSGGIARRAFRGSTSIPRYMRIVTVATSHQVRCVGFLVYMLFRVTVRVDIAIVHIYTRVPLVILGGLMGNNVTIRIKK